MPATLGPALGPKQQKLAENARAALELGNLDYAIEACQDILAECPGATSIRRLQRVALLRRAGSANTFTARLRGWLLILAGARRAKQNAEQLITFAGTVLTVDPKNVRALGWLAEAAQALSLPETAVFALEAVRELRPEDWENALALGAALIEIGRPGDALQLADSVLKLRPVDAAAQDLMRRASVAQTIHDGSWASSPAPRDQLASKPVVALSRPVADVVTPWDWTQRLIDEALERIKEEPENLTHYRTLVNGYRRLGRWEQGLDWIRKARALGLGAGDVALDREEEELQAMTLERRFREAEAMLARARDDEDARERWTKARSEWLGFRISQCRSTLHLNAGDHATRHALAKLQLELGEADLAIAEYHQIEAVPEFRVSALIGLGRALKRKRRFNDAIEYFSAAKHELVGMDDVRRDIIYELGGCLLLKGDIDGAMAEFKSIHSNPVERSASGAIRLPG